MKLLPFLLLCFYHVSTNKLDYVNPIIGTGGRGYGVGAIPVGAQIPFGMIRLSPDTCNIDEEWTPWLHTGGYSYYDSHIRMFSHIHLVGAGVVDLGGIGIFPTNYLPDKIGKTDFNRFPWMEPFNHTNEYATAGYYSVLLEKSNIFVELTASDYIGVHRYTFNDNTKTRYILFDVSYTLQYDACEMSNITINVINNEIMGYIHINGDLSSRFGGVKLYYIVRFNETFNNNIGTWKNGKLTKFNNINIINETGNDIGGWIEFDGNINSIEVYVGVSYINFNQAKINLEYDMNITNTFDSIKKNTQQRWLNKLDLVEIDNTTNKHLTNDNLTVFYTGIYHTFIAPTQYLEHNNIYLGFDLNTHTLNNNINNGYYSDISGWDVFRTEFPWLALMQSDIYGDILNSLTIMYQEGGDIPRWPLANGYTNCMFGTHMSISIADGVAHNLTHKFNINIAYNGLYQSATQTQSHAGRDNINEYINNGYVTYESNKKAACLTLAYAYDDWANSLIAKYLNKQNDYNMFLNRSNNYKTQFNPKNGLMCPKSINGTFNCPIDPFAIGDKYTEGNAWHYRFFVPHDIYGLSKLYNNVNDYISELNIFLERSFDDPFNELPNEYYWSGNEEDLFAPYSFIQAGYQYLTAKYVRKLLEIKYLNRYDGIPGNDDYGTMSAWGVWSYIGLFPRSGDGLLLIGSPYIGNITLKRNQGDIQILVYNAPNIYIKNATINGNILKNPWITVDQYLYGCKLQFWMTDNENDTLWNV